MFIKEAGHQLKEKMMGREIFLPKSLRKGGKLGIHALIQIPGSSF